MKFCNKKDTDKSQSIDKTLQMILTVKFN